MPDRRQPMHIKWPLLVASLLLLDGGPLRGGEARTGSGSREGTEPGAAIQIVPGSEEPATVVFLTRIMNRGETGLRAPRIHQHTPVALPHQTVNEIEVEGTPKRLTDRWGSPVLLYQLEQLAPQTTMTARWTAWVTIRRFRWDLSRATPRGAAPLLPEEQGLYLRDAEAFGLNDPVIAAAAGQAARGRSGPAATIEGIFDLVMDRLSYDRDGKWGPAPQVLTSGKGSCSEYSYCFIALCRKHGLPARYAGGIIGRSGVPFYLDKVFHRFPQAFVPDVGWVDFDPTRTDRANNKRLFFGQTPGPMLLLCVGDGGEGSLTGWDYLESHAWQDEKARASSLRQAWWFAPPPLEVRKQVEQFRQQLATTAAEGRSALVSRALAIGHPFVLPWLDDLLYEPAARGAAAQACLKIGGQGELAAVINCLGRLNDEAGDRQIGRLIEEFTGEKLGTDRARWNEWLKARTPRTPLPGDTPEKKP